MVGFRKTLVVFIFVCVSLLISLLGLGLFYVTNDQSNPKINEVTQFSSYDELYNYIKSNAGINKPIWKGQLENAIISANEAVADKGFSNTNIQVEGVDEADIIKTDGNYIYALSNKVLYIVSVKDGAMNIESSIKFTGTENIYSNSSEMYIYENRLVIIDKYYEIPFERNDFITGIYYPYNEKTKIIIYDIADKKSPIKLNEFSQDGYYLTSRMINNNIYLVIAESIFEEGIKEGDIKTFVPQLTIGQNSKSVDSKDIYVMPNPSSNSFVTISSIDVLNPNDYKSVKSILGSSGTVYSSKDNLFVTGYNTEEKDGRVITKTTITKFKLNDGIISLIASGSVNGSILNQFSMDEYNGHFRIVTTTNDYAILSNEIVTSSTSDEQGNNLYILDGNLNQVGKLEDIAKGERVYSVRFDADIAYFVTFKQVDPLFAVNVSNPLDPKILTELKIPGFSEYLHVYNDKYLFGLGKDADLEGRVTGLKISMFDISNKMDISEKFKTLVADKYSYSEASYNHKAILVSPEKGFIAFPLNNNYVIYSFNEQEGFEKIGDIKFDSPMYYSNNRGIYIGDYIYALNNKEIKSVNITKFEIVNNLIFPNE